MCNRSWVLIVWVLDSMLKSSDWGRRSLSFLDEINKLDSYEPAILNIRHTERHPITWDNNDEVLCTGRGKTGAEEFGASLPAGWSYKFWHTSSPRTLETGKAIGSGLSHNDIESRIVGEPSTGWVLDIDRFVKIRNGYQVFSDSHESARTLLSNWNKGMYPRDVITPPSEFGQGIAQELSENIGERCFHVLVSHDVWVAALMESWARTQPDDWVECLDGFLVQLKKDHMKVILHDRTFETEYPVWWNKLR